MASLHKVKVAKEALKKQLGAPPWLRGVGVMASDDGLCLQVGGTTAKRACKPAQKPTNNTARRRAVA